MNLENTINAEPILLSSAPEEELAVAEAQYSSVKSVFANVYKHVQGVLSNTSKKVSNFISSYPSRIKFRSKESYTGLQVQKQKGFTLTELLVTIAITGGLMAILLPSLQRVRKEAKSVVCQSNLRQWGVAFAAEGEIFETLEGSQPTMNWWSTFEGKGRDYFHRKDMSLCPMAMKLGSRAPFGFTETHQPLWEGSKFSAWGYKFPNKEPFACSYNINNGFQYNKKLLAIKNSKDVPVLFDSSVHLDTLANAYDLPPKYDDMPKSLATPEEATGCSICINRHDGFVNYLFLDLSARKVGLKELWTLKWNKDFNTAGPWTKAGGVHPEDWPKWMRKFKDY
jgi:prepilin-type N-terminal cleavage/methylation domain-containing protein/prepilin-type processing-associated H-X9-DG protein